MDINGASAIVTGGASGIGLGIAMLWFSLLVLIPLCAVIITAADGGWAAFWATITNDQTAAAIRLTVLTALGVTVVNVVMGPIIAWVLVRDEFRGKAALNAVIDLPFALPTIVAGLTLLTLYGSESPFGVNVAFSRVAVVMALLSIYKHRSNIARLRAGTENRMTTSSSSDASSSPSKNAA